MDEDAPGVFGDEDARNTRGSIPGQGRVQVQGGDGRTETRTRYEDDDDEDEYGEDASNVDTAAELVGNGSEWRDAEGRDGRREVL